MQNRERSTIAQRREEAMLDIAQRVDRILTRLPVTVKKAEASQLQGYTKECAGFTDGKDIYFNMDVIRPAIQKGSAQLISSIFGVNYHETAHILFTPRMDDPMVIEVQKRGRQMNDPMGLWYAFNLLEDMRAEMLFWATYEPSGVFFKTMVLDFVLKNDDKAEMSYPWLVGRLYLPTDFRNKARDIFIGDAERIAEVVEEYQRLVFPRNYSKGISLVVDFYHLLREMKEAAGLSEAAQLPSPSGHEQSKPSMSEGKSWSGNQEEGQKNLEYLKEWLDEMEAEAEAEESDDESDSDTEADGSGESVPDTGTQGQPGDAGTGDSQSMPSTDAVESFLDDLEDLLSETLADSDLAEQVKLAKDALDQASNKQGSASATGPSGESKPFVVKPGDRLASERVLQHLRQLRIDAEPSLHRDMSHGRIDPYKVMKANARLGDPKTVFDTWDPGMEDETEMDAIILIDQSSSMSYRQRDSTYAPYGGGHFHSVEEGTRIDIASRQMWIVKRALDKIGASVTVIGYNTEHAVLMQPSERMGDKEYESFNCSGGTDPSPALKESLRIFQRRYTPNKLLFILTDGEFQVDARMKRLIDELHHVGVITVFLPLIDGSSYEDHRDHETYWSHVRPIREMSDLSVAIGKVVQDLLRELTRFVMV